MKSARYKIVILPSVAKDIRRFPLYVLENLDARIATLSYDPFPPHSRKLEGTEGDYYRLRAGQYRIIYEVAKTIRILTIVKIGHRKDVYKK